MAKNDENEVVMTSSFVAKAKKFENEVLKERAAKLDEVVKSFVNFLESEKESLFPGINVKIEKTLSPNLYIFAWTTNKNGLHIGHENAMSYKILVNQTRYFGFSKKILISGEIQLVYQVVEPSLQDDLIIKFNFCRINCFVDPIYSAAHDFRPLYNKLKSLKKTISEEFSISEKNIQISPFK